MDTLPSLLTFLHTELSIPAASLDLAIRQTELPSQLPMVLWQYGLVSLNQLDQIFDWMEQRCW
jgi:hypothetical protein